jgi:opacity protein-like surface antigen
MNLAKRIAVGLAGALLMFSASSAMAADVQPVIPAQPPVVIVPPPPPGFDWQGAYVGAFLTLEFDTDPFAVDLTVVGGQVGFNIVRGSFVFGPQLRIGYLIPEPAIVATLGPRFGVLLGAQQRLLLYAAASLGYIPAFPALFYTVGGGVEFGIGQRFSVFGETRLLGGGPGCCVIITNVGANFHF